MNDEPLKPDEQFHTAMLDIYHRALAETGYKATRFLQLVRDKGGLEAARQLLENPTMVSEGFTQLALKGRLDLTVEALVLEEPWNTLFSNEQLATAKRRLKSG